MTVRWICSFAFSVALAGSASAATAIPGEYSGARPGAGNGPTEVTIGLYLIDVSSVTASDESFTADLFMLLRWRDPRLAEVFAAAERVPLDEVWTPPVLIVNRRQVESSFPELAEIEPDGTVVVRQRVSGTFAAPLDLHDFPLDRQRFFIRFAIPGYTPEEIRLVPPPSDLAGSSRAANFTISDWELGEISVRAEPYRIGDSRREIAGYILAFEGRRHIGYWAGTAFTSVAIIIAMSCLVFWLDPKFVAPRLSVAVTSMLTLIAYRFLLGGVLPRLSYLTRMDFFLTGATVLVLLSVVQVVWTTTAEDRDHHRSARRINLHSRWLFPLGFLAIMAVSFSV